MIKFCNTQNSTQVQVVCVWCSEKERSRLLRWKLFLKLRQHTINFSKSCYSCQSEVVINWLRSRQKLKFIFRQYDICLSPVTRNRPLNSFQKWWQKNISTLHVWSHHHLTILVPDTHFSHNYKGDTHTEEIVFYSTKHEIFDE